MPRMTWRPLGICVLTVALGACTGSSPTEASGTVGTRPTATTVARSTAVTAAAPSTTADLGPGPTDAEIQKILDHTDAKIAEIFAAFKPGLVITPAIDKLIVESFGPVADDIRETLGEHAAADGRLIRVNPKPPRSVIRNVVSRSDNCFVVSIDYDASPMLDTSPEQLYELFRNVNSGWIQFGGVDPAQLNLFEGRPCNVR